MSEKKKQSFESVVESSNLLPEESFPIITDLRKLDESVGLIALRLLTVNNFEPQTNVKGSVIKMYGSFYGSLTKEAKAKGRFGVITNFLVTVLHEEEGYLEYEVEPACESDLKLAYPVPFINLLITGEITTNGTPIEPINRACQLRVIPTSSNSAYTVLYYQQIKDKQAEKEVTLMLKQRRRTALMNWLRNLRHPFKGGSPGGGKGRR